MKVFPEKTGFFIIKNNIEPSIAFKSIFKVLITLHSITLLSIYRKLNLSITMGLIKTGIQLAGAYGLLRAGSKYVLYQSIMHHCGSSDLYTNTLLLGLPMNFKRKSNPSRTTRVINAPAAITTSNLPTLNSSLPSNKSHTMSTDTTTHRCTLLMVPLSMRTTDPIMPTPVRNISIIRSTTRGTRRYGGPSSSSRVISALSGDRGFYCGVGWVMFTFWWSELRA